MANSLLTIDMITRESARVLANELVLCRKVSRQYDDSFARSGAKIGSSLRIRLPDRALVTDGATLAVQDENQQYTTINATTQKHIGLAFTQAEQVMSLDDYSKNIIQPRVSQLAATIDNDLASCYKYIGQLVGTAGTTPATSAVLLAATQKLDEAAAPRGDRFAVVNPAANAALVEGMKGLFNPVSTVSKQFKNGMMGEGILGLSEMAMSQSIQSHTTGTRTGSCTVATTVSAEGATTLALTINSGGTATAGDVFTVAGVYAVNPQTRQSTGSLFQFHVPTATTAVSTTLTLTVDAMYSASHALATMATFPQSGDVVTWVGAASTAYPQNIIAHQDAIAFVTADLPLPGGVDQASRIVHDGISITVVKDFDIVNYRTICRLDVLYGWAVIRKELACRLIG